jgi:hypothetical protein
MKTILSAIICTIIMAISALSGNAKTIHAVSFCDTDDAIIGHAVVISHDMFIHELSDLAYLLNYECNFMDYSGEDLSKENLEKMIFSINSNVEDIIVFYYFGHAARAEDQVSPFPQMCLKYEISEEDMFVPVQYVINSLRNQPAHLKLIISSCNNTVAQGISSKNTMCDTIGELSMCQTVPVCSVVESISTNQTNVDNYKKLFNDFTGIIAITSSKPGQYSWCNSRIGGFFDVELWKAIDAVGNNELPADWNSIFSAVQSKTDEVAVESVSNSTHQEPYFEINKVDR